jgi:hypothetical protein
MGFARGLVSQAAEHLEVARLLAGMVIGEGHHERLDHHRRDRRALRRKAGPAGR